jgi:hypothetical protein
MYMQQGPQAAAVQEPDTGQIQDYLITGPAGPAHEDLQLAGGHQIQLPANGDHGDAPEIVAREREITHTPSLNAQVAEQRVAEPLGAS